MKTIIDRKPRSEEEGVALCVRCCSEEPHFWQFKIDVWSVKRSGLYKMRLDGFDFLRIYEAESLDELMWHLITLESETVIAERLIKPEQMLALADRMEPKQADALRDRYSQMTDALISKYYKAARTAMLDELEPMTQSGGN